MDAYHHVCLSQPYCLCAGVGSDDCACLPDGRDVQQSRCANCGKSMAAIDIETGEILESRRASSYTTEERATP